MPQYQTQCPECGASITSETAIVAGQTLLCTKCETYVTVSTEASPKRPASEKRSRDPMPVVRAKKSFSIGTAVLAVALLVLIAGGVYSFVWYQNRQAEQRAKDEAERKANPPKMNGPIQSEPPKVTKKPRDRTPPKTTTNTGDELAKFVNDISGNTPTPSAAETQRQIDMLRKLIIGTWKSKPGDPMVRTIDYRDDGTFRDEVTGANGRVLEGTWEVAGLAGKKGLKLKRSGPALSLVRVTIEDGELIHDSDIPGATSVLVKP